ncbi:MAG: alpha/beta hydrolase [Pseudomonadota bacterium]
MPQALKAGFDTYWTSFGQGPKPALMIHCSLAHSGSWGRMARHLSGALTMTAFDMPGHGRSAAWDDRGEIQEVTTRIAADLLDGPVHVVGHSFGATVALRLAVMHPELVQSLLLIEPVFYAVALTDQPELQSTFKDQMRGFNEAMQADDLPAAAVAFLQMWGGGADWHNLTSDEQYRLAAQMPLVAAAEAALYDDVGGMLSPGVMEAINVPVLLLEGSTSPQIISAINTGLAARLPRTQRAVIAGAGHMLPITHAKQVSAEVLRFLRTF